MLQVVLVEAFAEQACQGNGAAVVLLQDPVNDAILQGVATSLNQSETAFLWCDKGAWKLRWFTPSREVPLCGHATLAACVALGHWGLLLPLQPIKLLTKSGRLRVQLEPAQAGETTAALMELPAHQLIETQCPAYLEKLLMDRLGMEPQAFWSSSLGYSVALVSASCPLQAMDSLASELQSEESQGLVVMQAIDHKSDPAPSVRGRSADYQMRFFAPGLGIPEDPVTGSAHALVAPYWMQIHSKDEVVGWQCSPRPGGMVCLRMDASKIQITGSAYLLLEGSINLGVGGAGSHVSGLIEAQSNNGWGQL